MPYRDPEKRREAVRKSQQKAYLANPEKFRAKAREWAKLHPRPGSHNKKGTPSYERSLEALREWKAADPERVRKAGRDYVRRLKLDVIAGYGGKCECCGTTYWEHLSIDHIHGGGAAHRKVERARDFYIRLRNEGFPKGEYRLLCISCNFSFGLYGYCPHQRERQIEEVVSEAPS